MPKLLTQTEPKELLNSAEFIRFNKSLTMFYGLPSMKALFDQLLAEEDLTITLFEGSDDPSWNKQSREIRLPFNCLRDNDDYELFLTLTDYLCHMNGLRDDFEFVFRLLRDLRNSSDSFKKFTDSINVSATGFAFTLTLAVRSIVDSQNKPLSEEQEQLLAFGLMPLNTQDIKRSKAAELNKVFAILRDIKPFRELLKDVSKQQNKPVQIHFDHILANNGQDILVDSKVNFLINPDMNIANMIEDIVVHLIKSDNPCHLCRDYQDSFAYASAMIREAYDNFIKANTLLIDIYESNQMNDLYSHCSPELPPEIRRLIIAKKIGTWMAACSMTYRQFVNSNPGTMKDHVAQYEKWQQQAHNQTVTQSEPEDLVRHITPAFQTHVQGAPAVEPQARSNRMLPAVPLQIQRTPAVEPQTRSNRRLPPVPMVPTQSIDQGTVDINLVKKSLEKYKEFACSDAKSYSQCIYPGKEAEVINRYKNKPDFLLRNEAQANATLSDPATFRYSENAIKHVGRLINRAKSGCCTTLALSALSELLDMRLNMKVYMVASPVEQGTAHCFLLAKDARENVYVIDPWLASLGWEAFYPIEDYPMRKYLQNLSIYFESDNRSKVEADRFKVS